MAKIVKRGDRSLVRQLTDILLEQVRSGQLRAGSKLPSERELTAMYDVSRTTARNAILELAHAGVVRRAVGSGTYVAPGEGREIEAAMRTGTIGLLVCRHHFPVRNIQEDFYYYGVMEGVQSELRSSKRHLLFSYLDENDEENARVIAELAVKVDGFLLAEINSVGLVQRVGELALPYVLINPSIEDIDQRFDSLSINNLSGAHMAVRHLIELGHRNVGCIRGPAYSVPARDRFDGYCRALADAGIPFAERFVVQVDGWTPETGSAAARELLERAPEVSALFCASDTLAIGAISGIRDRRSVPEDTSVVGFDDSTLAPHSDPPLTTVRSPTFELGKQACKQLLTRLRGSSQPVTRIALSPELKVRESSARCRKKHA